MRLNMSKAFGPIEAVLTLVLVSLATWGVVSTMLRRSASQPSWLQPVPALWI